MNSVWASIFSDLLINLAAGWIGAIIIVPNFSRKTGLFRLFILTSDLILAIVCIGIGYYLRGLL